MVLVAGLSFIAPAALGTTVLALRNGAAAGKAFRGLGGFIFLRLDGFFLLPVFAALWTFHFVFRNCGAAFLTLDLGQYFRRFDDFGFFRRARQLRSGGSIKKPLGISAVDAGIKVGRFRQPVLYE